MRLVIGTSQGEPSGSVGECSNVPSASRGGWVRMFGFAVARERHAVRRLSGWARDYLLQAAVADLACAILGVSTAVQLTASSAQRIRHTKTSCLKTITAICRQTCHRVMQAPSARASA